MHVSFWPQDPYEEPKQTVCIFLFGAREPENPLQKLVPKSNQVSTWHESSPRRGTSHVNFGTGLGVEEAFSGRRKQVREEGK